jgi:hypothetical protein
MGIDPKASAAESQYKEPNSQSAETTREKRRLENELDKAKIEALKNIYYQPKKLKI